MAKMANIEAYFKMMFKEDEERREKGIKLTKHDWQAKNCISFWLPIVKSVAGIKTPETIIFHPDVDLYDFVIIAEEEEVSEKVQNEFHRLVKAIEGACAKLGYPAFLRTGDYSGKHSWEKTCFIENHKTNVMDHVVQLISEATMRSLTLVVWCVREFLETEPLFFAFDGKMPITRERRFFIKDGEVIGSIPYWPVDAFIGQYTSTPNWPELIKKLKDEPDLAELTALTSKVAGALTGAWSVDWLKTKKGWYLTDCALAGMSWGSEFFPALASQT